MATKVRLIGDEDEIRAVLQGIHDAPGVRVVDTSGARPTRYGEGKRVYATVEVALTQHAQESGTAAGPAKASSLKARRGAKEVPGE